jgi:CDP-glucose 4,6-dehydratase
MNIAITGATGLLGTSLCNFYSNLGHSVYALIKDEHSSLSLNKNINKVYGNINSKTDVDYFIQKSIPDHFIHLAAQTQAYDSLKYPYNTFYTNVVGTLNVLDSLKEYSKCKSIIVASSDKAYGELNSNEYTEDHPLNGIYPYDASKSMTDILTRSYSNTYGMPIVTTRSCNIYGVGDHNQERLIPGIIISYLKNKKFLLRNGGQDIREYIHVDDVVSAYDHIRSYIEKGGFQKSFNISSGDRYKTIEIFNIVRSIIGKDINHEVLSNTSLEIKKQFMDSSLLKNETGWEPKHTIESSIKETVLWYVNNL